MKPQPEPSKCNMENATQTGTTRSPTINEARPTEVATEQLDQVIGGLQFVFKLVAVKTVSWAHDS
jgi:hypothetical protein